MTTTLGKTINVCQTHPRNDHPTCWSCWIAIDWNVVGQRCACGNKATGYRAMGAETPVEFFCDEHFEGVPVVGATFEEVTHAD